MRRNGFLGTAALAGLAIVFFLLTGCSSATNTSSSSSTTATTTTLSASATSVATETNITLSATVAPSSAAGTVTFYSGSSSLGAETIGGGSATLTTSFGTAGAYSITATYSGSSTYAASTSSALSLAVTSSASTTPTISMIAIPAGTFYDGYAYMTISTAFNMSEYPITQSQYEAVMDSNPSVSGSGSNYPVDSANWYQAIVFCNTLSIAEGLTPVYSINGSTNPDAWGTIPVSGGGANMTWDSVTMAKGVNGYRLPTSSEWMWAAMGGLQDGLASDVVTNSTYGTVNQSGYLKGYAGSTEANGGTSNIGNYCWYSGNSGGRTQSVGGKLPNEFGLYDMCGNVGEYTFDYYWGEEQGATNGNPVAIPFPTTDETDYTGLAAGTGVWRWMLGASFADATGYMTILPQGAYVKALNPSIAKDYVGFRVVKGGAY